MTGEARPDDDLDAAGPLVEYRFFDSSVPPPFHRSYTLVVRPGEARVVVDSYGDVLHDERVPLDTAEWERCAMAAAALGGLADTEFDDGYTGGTADRLVVRDRDGQVVVSRFESHRGIDPSESPLRAPVAAILARLDLSRGTVGDDSVEPTETDDD